MDNYGVIQGGTFDLGAGNDVVINRPGSDPSLARIDPCQSRPGRGHALHARRALRRVKQVTGNRHGSHPGWPDRRPVQRPGRRRPTHLDRRKIRNIDMGNWDGYRCCAVQLPPASRPALGGPGRRRQGSRTTGCFGVAAFGPSRFTLWERVEFDERFLADARQRRLDPWRSGTSTGTLSIESEQHGVRRGGNRVRWRPSILVRS